MESQMPQETTPNRDELVELLSKLRTQHSGSNVHLDQANEAETRLMIVDRILEALGWPKRDFRPESPAKGAGYTDYILTVDNVGRLIVEAKRTGYTFRSPRTPIRRSQYTLKYLRTCFGTALSDVVEQAQKYANTKGIPFALLTNGAEWVLVKLLPTPGYGSVEELSHVYFGNIFGDGFNTELFWELLNRRNVDEGSLEVHFADLYVREAEVVELPNEMLGGFAIEHATSSGHLREYYDLFFDEIIDPSKRMMLDYCYVSDSQLDQYQGELQRALRDTAPTYLGQAEELTPGSVEEPDRVVVDSSGSVKGRVILLTGSVGCGKSTFVTRLLVRARSDEAMSSRLCVLLLDLIDDGDYAPEIIDERLWKRLRERWFVQQPESSEYDVLKRIFEKQLATLRRGPKTRLFTADASAYEREEALLLQSLLDDSETFFEACWRHYQTKNKGIVVVLDNVDRASENYQRHVYSFAHRLARSTGATVILTMRENTFFRGRDAGFLDVRSGVTIFHLQSPNIKQIVTRRLRYIAEHLDEDPRLSAWRRNSAWLDFSAAITEHTDCLKRTFLESKEGDDRLSVLNAVSWHDVRLFLELLRRVHLVLGSQDSPWSFTDIIAVLTLATDTGMRSPLLPNVFRPPYPAFQCYFLKLRLIIWLCWGNAALSRRAAPYASIVRFLGLYGYLPNWVRHALQELVRERLLECIEAPSAADFTRSYEVQIDHNFRISPLAVLIVERLAAESVYIGLSGNTLPFHNSVASKAYVSELRDLLEAQGGRNLETASISLLRDTAAVGVVCRYLLAQLALEAAPENLAKHFFEMRTTETKLSSIADRLSKQANHEYIDIPTRIPGGQLALFEQGEGPSAGVSESIPIPLGIGNAMLGRSQAAPLILWALVNLRYQGVEWADGAEITRVINGHLLDDHNKKEPNNISRALRSKVLQSQSWLAMRVVSARKSVFSLREGWRECWLETFGELAPAVDF